MSSQILFISFSFATLCSLTLGVITSTTYTNSLEDCEAFASLFFNTCETNPSQNDLDFTALAVSTESCNYAGQCPDGSSNTYCEWDRVLCVSCYQSGSSTVIRVQTNGLPNHCYYAPYNAPSSNPVDFSVLFNPETTVDSDNKATTLSSIIDDQVTLTTQQCDLSWPQNTQLPADTDFQIVSNSSNIDKIIGVSLNGVFLKPGIGEIGYDAFYPQAYSSNSNPTEIDPDLCLGSSTYTSAYHYYMFSPCILDQKIKNIAAPCSSNSRCTDDKITYYLRLMSSESKSLVPIGIAKDGRIIYGPYNDKGQLWQACDVDVCNGRVINGHYAYVTTIFYPYFVGCWGPGNDGKNISPDCTTKARFCSWANFFTSIPALILSAVIIVLVNF